MDKIERRKKPRHKVNVNVAVVTGDAVSFDAVATEISDGGIRIRAAKAIFPGSNLVIFLQLPDEEVEFRGKVRWALDSIENGKPFYEIGVKTNMIVSPGKRAYKEFERVEIVEKICSKLGKTKQFM